MGRNLCKTCNIRGCDCPSKTEIRRAYGKKLDIAARLARVCAGPGNGECPLGMKPTETTLHHFHWDHLVPAEKTWDVSQMHMKPDSDYNAEIAKCELVCLFCHADRTRAGGHLGRPKKGTLARHWRPVGRPRKDATLNAGSSFSPHESFCDVQPA